MDSILIAAGSWWLEPGNWLAMFKVACGLGFVIFVHELGHFAVAKMCGVKCEKFYIGFDFFELKIGKYVILPRALFKFKYGETEYGIGNIPLGGYVKMLGQDDNPGNMEAENERSRVSGTEGAEEKVVHDPRSYLAKSVPQRMAIISAGVIMNLIFAVIFATIAYMVGVPYIPCVIGETIPGGAAWRAGLGSGDQVIQINNSGKPSEHLRFDWDLRNATGMAGLGGEVELLVRTASGEEKPFQLRPRPLFIGTEKLPTLGVLGLSTTSLAAKQPVDKASPAGQTKTPFEGNDKVVAIRSKSESAPHPVTTNAEIESLLTQKRGETVVVTVERAEKGAKVAAGSPTQVEIEVAPQHFRSLGLVMKRGPITGVRPHSPAEVAGLKEGDVIHRFAGQRFGDPMTFPDRLAPYYGQEIAIEVEREDDKGNMQPLSLKIVPEQPKREFRSYSEGSDFSVESLGIVYPVYQIVQKVEAGSPAAKAGLQHGDEITQVQAVPTADQKKEEEERTSIGIEKPFKLNAEHASWPFVDELVQHVLPETQIKLVYLRPNGGAKKAESSDAKASEGEIREALLLPVDSPYFQSERGLHFALTKLPHKAESLGEAISLGFRQTGEDAMKIVTVLKKLVTGKLSPTNLAGPASIAYIATSEAAQGTSRLLIFLTFLSANLAVVNFLPIPVLDGGHMMFLSWEGIFRRPVPEKWQFSLTIAGLAFVLCLFLFTNGMDVKRFIVDPLMRWLG